MSELKFQKTLIIGLGLIGGSFAYALKKNNLVTEIFACDTDQETIDFATASDLIKNGCNNLNLLDEKFDLIVIAAPLESYEEIFYQLENLVKPQGLIIDLGSLKDFIAEILPKKLSKNFIACHPIAGSEKSGLEHSSAEMFDGKKIIICPNKNSDISQLQKAEKIFTKIGANIEKIDAKTHDKIYALVSHLPQFLSFLTKEFSPENIKDEILCKAFRLDDSNPEIWSEIFAINEENIEEFYLEFFDNLEKNILEIDSFKNKTSSNTYNPQNLEFFSDNFAPLFFRALVVKSYLEIEKIKTYEIYAGKGFQDFTSAKEILNFESSKLAELITKNQKKIVEIFKSLS